MAKVKEVAVATSVFLLEEIKLKKDRAWRVKATLKTQLPESFREYGVRLSLNEEPYNMRINDVEKRRSEVEKENQLFGDAKKKQLKGFDQQVKDIEEEIEMAKGECPEFSFDGVVEELKYKDSDTVVVMIVPAEAVNDLNANRKRLGDYKIELLRAE